MALSEEDIKVLDEAIAEQKQDKKLYKNGYDKMANKPGLNEIMLKLTHHKTGTIHFLLLRKIAPHTWKYIFRFPKNSLL